MTSEAYVAKFAQCNGGLHADWVAVQRAWQGAGESASCGRPPPPKVGGRWHCGRQPGAAPAYRNSWTTNGMDAPAVATPEEWRELEAVTRDALDASTLRRSGGSAAGRGWGTVHGVNITARRGVLWGTLRLGRKRRIGQALPLARPVSDGVS